MKKTISIVIADERWEPFLERTVRSVLRYACAALSVSHRSVSVLLTHQEEMHALNKQFRGKDATTNVLAFPVADGADPMLGDIAISYEHVCSGPVDIKNCVAHLTVHALLHLLGYDHECDDEAALMEKKDTQLLQAMGFSDPYA